ncbi:MAG: hypothetical protein HZC29_02810 [Thaumarchaeota archaeon]|nr:hypothetical protein [Nitrososphaerota archaeon]
MADLNMSVFENYTIKEVIGETPPADSILREKLEKETSSLIKDLDTKSKPELQKILSDQLKIKQEITKFSGAMALDQPKIEMFHHFIAKYIKEIKTRLIASQN